jgi:hypothetical protein
VPLLHQGNRLLPADVVRAKAWAVDRQGMWVAIIQPAQKSVCRQSTDRALGNARAS